MVVQGIAVLLSLGHRCYGGPAEVDRLGRRLKRVVQQGGVCLAPGQAVPDPGLLAEVGGRREPVPCGALVQGAEADVDFVVAGVPRDGPEAGLDPVHGVDVELRDGG